MRTLGAVVAAAGLWACGGTDGANGTQGKVRFSQVYNFQETHDFSPPLATASSLMVKLEQPSAVASGEATAPGFPELKLEVHPVGHSGGSTVLPMGFGQFVISVDAEGPYQLDAKDKDTLLDSLQLTAKKADHVRFSPKATVVTTGKNAKGESCVQIDSTSLSEVVLHKNQRISYFVAAADSADHAMLGLLGLTAHGDGLVSLDTPWVLEQAQPNGVVVVPSGKTALGATSVLTIDEASGLTFTQSVATADSDAACQ